MSTGNFSQIRETNSSRHFNWCTFSKYEDKFKLLDRYFGWEILILERFLFFFDGYKMVDSVRGKKIH